MKSEVGGRKVAVDKFKCYIGIFAWRNLRELTKILERENRVPGWRLNPGRKEAEELTWPHISVNPNYANVLKKYFTCLYINTHTHTHTHTCIYTCYRVINYTPPSPTHVFHWLREVTQRNSYLVNPLSVTQTWQNWPNNLKFKFFNIDRV
jgi:hypothetical protein